MAEVILTLKTFPLTHHLTHPTKTCCLQHTALQHSSIPGAPLAIILLLPTWSRGCKNHEDLQTQQSPFLHSKWQLKPVPNTAAGISSQNGHAAEQPGNIPAVRSQGDICFTFISMLVTVILKEDFYSQGSPPTVVNPHPWSTFSPS